jgi:hypothetical protein
MVLRQRKEHGVKVLRMTTDQLATDDGIADLLIEYAKVLGKADDTDTVVLPVVRDGRVEHASILLGPASQITLTEDHDEGDTGVEIPDADEVIADLRGRIDRLSGTHHVVIEDDDQPAAFQDFDEL